MQWGHADLWVEWKLNAVNGRGKLEKWHIKSLPKDGWMLSASFPRRTGSYYYLVDPEADSSVRVFGSTREARLALGQEGFELVALSEEHFTTSGHRLYLYKRHAEPRSSSSLAG